MLLDLATVMGEQTSLSQQLDRAAKVRRDLLPRNVPTLSGYDFAGTCVPSFAIGGDFYDWHGTEDGVDFTVADVMGKGIPAAIVTATVRAVMRGVDRADGPGSALRAAAVALLFDLEDTGTFVTVFHGHLHGPTGTVVYADAGHGLTLLVHGDGTFTQHASDDLPLGIARDGTWTEWSITLDPGDTLVCFSDGLFDLLGGTTDAMIDVAAMVSGATSCAHLVERVTTLAAKESALIDDITLVAIRRAPPVGCPHEPPHTDESPTTSKVPRLGGEMPVVLLVEDEPDQLSLLTAYFRRAGCTVVGLTDAEQALRLPSDTHRHFPQPGSYIDPILNLWADESGNAGVDGVVLIEIPLSQCNRTSIEWR